MKARKLPKEEIDKKIREIAEKTGITEHLNKKINALSGGQQQRVAIARAIVLQPKILLMDEPLSNLDAKLRVSTREEIRKLQKTFGITTIYVTHDQEEAMAISDRIAVFNVGKLEQIGTPKEIYGRPQNSVVAKFIGDINVMEGEADQVFRKAIKTDSDKKFYVRPHNVKISRNCSESVDTICVEGVVDSYEYLGSYTKINIVTKDGNRITSTMFGEKAEFSEGEKVFAEVKTSEVLALI